MNTEVISYPPPASCGSRESTFPPGTTTFFFRPSNPLLLRAVDRERIPLLGSPGSPRGVMRSMAVPFRGNNDYPPRGAELEIFIPTTYDAQEQLQKSKKEGDSSRAHWTFSSSGLILWAPDSSLSWFACPFIPALPSHSAINLT